MGAAAGFVEAGGAYDDELLALAEALGVDGGLAADHADGGELGDLVGEGHEVGDGAEGLGGEGGVEAGHEDAFAEVDQLDAEGDDGSSKNWTSSMPMTSISLSWGKSGFAEALDGGDGGGVVGLLAVAGDGGAVVAEVDVGLVAGDALAGDAGALEAADELFGLAGEHGAGDDFEAAGGGCGHVRRALFGWSLAILNGWGGG